MTNKPIYIFFQTFNVGETDALLALISRLGFLSDLYMVHVPGAAIRATVACRDQNNIIELFTTLIKEDQNGRIIMVSHDKDPKQYPPRICWKEVANVLAGSLCGQ